MTELTYDDLPQALRDVLCNGCGGKGGWVRPPALRSRVFCDRHDVAYFAGGTEDDRRVADRRLYERIKQDASERPWWQQPTFRMQAWLYYRAVRLFGRRYFHYGEKRTLESVLEPYLAAKYGSKPMLSLPRTVRRHVMVDPTLDG